MRRIKPKKNAIKSAAAAAAAAPKPKPKSKAAKKTTRIYRCGSCFDSFGRYLDCKQHEQICEAENARIHVCKYCLMLWGDAHMLKRHIARRHADRLFVCLQCGAVAKHFCSATFLYNHVMKWHGKHWLYYCALCYDENRDVTAFSCRALLTSHAEYEHKLFCSGDGDGGGSAFDETEDLEMLEENIDDLLPVVDWDDDLQFGWPVGLSKEDCIAAYVCPVCGNGFSGALNLLKHIEESHKQRNPLICIYCGKSHETREAARCHLQRQHTLVRHHVCPHDGCQRDFATADHLHKHVQSKHTSERKHVCPHPQCGKAFAQRQHLKQHQESHTGIKSHICALCDEQFWRRIDLERHVNTKHA